MESILERLIQPSILIPFFIFGLPMLLWAIQSSIVGCAKARAIEAEINLKRELVAQGRSADDIAKIMGHSKAGRLDA